jgi:hypothetical protein
MPEIKFPSGQFVLVEFDDVAHSYVVAHKLADGKFTDTRPTHGITAPLEVVPKPYLTPWGAKMGVEALLEELRNHPLDPEQLEQFFIDKALMDENARTENDKPVMSTYKFKKLYPWFGKAKSAYKEKSKEGKEIGSWIHGAIETYYKSARQTIPELNEFTTPVWESFVMFDNFFKPFPDSDGLEFLVYSLMFGYSGQGDYRGMMSGKHCIGDWKSTNRSSANKDGISSENFFQLGGLAQAEFERTGKWVEDLFIANFDKKGDEPRVIWASDFGASPQDCARAYISCFMNYHTIKEWDYKFSKR